MKKLVALCLLLFLASLNNLTGMVFKKIQKVPDSKDVKIIVVEYFDLTMRYGSPYITNSHTITNHEIKDRNSIEELIDHLKRREFHYKNFLRIHTSGYKKILKIKLKDFSRQDVANADTSLLALFLEIISKKIKIPPQKTWNYE